jgi:hypothetical protein
MEFWKSMTRRAEVFGSMVVLMQVSFHGGTGRPFMRR